MRHSKLLALNAVPLLAVLAACGDSSPTGPAARGTAAHASLAAGGYHNCRIVGTTTECWGYNGNGQLGDGTTNSRSAPAAVSGGLTFVHVAAGYDHTCALTSAGKAYCWGYNGDGQLGDGSFNDSSTPVAVAGGLTFTSLSIGDSHNCGLTSSGTAYCWGYNYANQLGDGSSTDQATPVPVNTTLKFAKVTAIGSHSCGLTSAGAAYCWGDNWRGKLGNGNEDEQATPTAVLGGHVFAQIVGGYDHTCGLTTAGAAYCWGYNGDGELGTGTVDDIAHGTPEAVAGGITFRSLSDGRFDQLCGLTDAGVAYCWGYNYYGQVGDGTTDDRSTPVAIGGSLRFKNVAAGDSHTCATTTANATYCWGYNGDGEVGDGSYTDQYSPTLVTTAATATLRASVVAGTSTDATSPRLQAGSAHGNEQRAR